MHATVRLLATLAANAFLGTAILIFAIGFFPHKAVLPGLAQWPVLDDGVGKGTTESPSHTHHGGGGGGDRVAATSAPFDRVIFMVVDALRSDFVYGNNSQFIFTHSLVRSGAAVPFTGHASPPTITMPRVKAITTGSVPSFIDLVLNFAESDTTSTLALQDSWLAQIRAHAAAGAGGKLVMYGDDTWLRLFPNFFERADGTTSFFVSDFTEVDLNVTRHVPAELKRDDWSGMIMHYLGLDHIGHKTGPGGPNMPSKQREMDAIVKQIYLAMEQENHLADAVLVLLGDHGMNEAGNHGANSAGETSTALTFISPKFKSAFGVAGGVECPQSAVTDFAYYDVVEQSDIAPTLAALLGLPIPKNSLGVIIPKLLGLWRSPQDRFDMLYANAAQVQQIALATFPDAFTTESLGQCSGSARSGDEHEVACEWQAIVEMRSQSSQTSHEAANTDLDRAQRQVTQFLKRAQSVLGGAASKYDLSKMTTGIGLVVVSLVLSLIATVKHVFHSGLSGFVFTLMTVLYAVTMFASSYVEEEHQFWYWFTSAWLVILISKTGRWASYSSNKATTFLSRHSHFSGSVLVAVGYGFVRRWNQTGQKYAGDPDIVTEVISRPPPYLLWVLVILTYTTVCLKLSSRLFFTHPRSGAERMIMSSLPLIVTVSAFVFKLAFTSADAPELLEGIPLLKPVSVYANSHFSLVTLAQTVFLGVAGLLIGAVAATPPWHNHQDRRAFLEALHDAVSLFLITQTRTVNIPLLFIFELQLYLLSIQTLETSTSQRPLSPLETTVTSLVMQYSSFFAMGGTNAISSVDLSNAYNGVAGYNVLAVGVLTFVSNWTGAVWWVSATSCVLWKNDRASDVGRAGAAGAAVSESANGANISNKQQKSTQAVSVTLQDGHHGSGGVGSERIALDHFAVLTLFASASTLAVMVACMVLREHLFIWTVFSPKYLYCVAWVFGQHFVVNGLIGSLLLGPNKYQ